MLGFDAKYLIDVARGEVRADLLLVNARIADVRTGEVYPANGSQELGKRTRRGMRSWTFQD